MIPNNTDTVKVVNNIDAADTGQFSVDENSLGKIMSVLTNLYSDPELAVIREYLTNALDAQIEAQESDPNYVWRPIEVTTPSYFNKEYKVRDFGIGMSVDDIRDIYSKYGKSTKESSNSVTGMLGLGSKCALTYTGQFTITGFKNGVRTMALVSKDDNDIPVFMIVDTRATDEPNGVEISVPVRDRNSFAEKTKNFLKWWVDGQVLVDGMEPEKHGLTEVKPGVFLIEPDDYRYAYGAESYVIMGNVPYGVDSSYVDESLRNAGMGFAAYVPMGAVDFPPSREKLFYNNRSKKVIADISEGLFEAILDEKIKEITDAPTAKEAFLAKMALPRHFSNHSKVKNLTYNGHAFVATATFDHTQLDWDWNGHGRLYRNGSINIKNTIASGGALIVTGVKPGTNPTSYFKRKVRQYMLDNNIKAASALLVEDDVDDFWINWMPRVTSDDIKAVKLLKNPSSTPRKEAEYDYMTWDGSKAEHQSSLTITVPAGKTLVYTTPADLRESYRKSGINMSEVVRNLGDEYIVAYMSKNRFDKFLRTHPGAITLQAAFDAKMVALVSSATDVHRVVSELSYGEKKFFETVDSSKIDDPEVQKVATIVQSHTKVDDPITQANQLVNAAHRASCTLTVPQVSNTTIINPVKKYPLIDEVGSRHINHLLIYMNSIYALNNKS